MGGASSSKVKVQPHIEPVMEVPCTKQSDFPSADEKPSATEHQGDYLKSLALGDMKNGWGDQYRDYDGTLKEVGKNRQMKVEWSDDEVKPQPTPMKTPVKQPPSQQRPTPPSKPRPPPPMHRPSNALAQKPTVPTTPASHTVVYAPPTSATPPPAQRATFTPERRFSSDDDADTVNTSGMNTNEHLQALYYSGRQATDSSIRYTTTSSSKDDGDYIAEFSGDSTKTPTRPRPDSVPPLNLDSPVTAPLTTPSIKPSPPMKHPPVRPLSVNVNMQATMNPSPSPHATSSNARYTTPTRAPRPSGPIPAPPPRPVQARHAVKETKDVKRNRAQLPATLTHAKPTTGDWLKKRYIVNNYILLDTLGTGSYAEVTHASDIWY